MCVRKKLYTTMQMFNLLHSSLRVCAFYVRGRNYKYIVCTHLYNSHSKSKVYTNVYVYAAHSKLLKFIVRVYQFT